MNFYLVASLLFFYLFLIGLAGELDRMLHSSEVEMRRFEENEKRSQRLSEKI